jgi:hypothetical protein
VIEYGALRAQDINYFCDSRKIVCSFGDKEVGMCSAAGCLDWRNKKLVKMMTSITFFTSYKQKFVCIQEVGGQRFVWNPSRLDSTGRLELSSSVK